MFKKIDYRGFSVTLEVKLNYSESPQKRGETGHTVIATGLPVSDDETTKNYEILHGASIEDRIVEIEADVMLLIDQSIDTVKSKQLSSEESLLQTMGFEKVY